RGCLPYLSDKADHHQRFDMVGKGRGRDFQPFLQAADRHPQISGAHERAVDFEPGGIAQGFEMCGGVVESHPGSISEVSKVVNYISRNIEIHLAAIKNGMPSSRRSSLQRPSYPATGSRLRRAR